MRFQNILAALLLQALTSTKERRTSWRDFMLIEPEPKRAQTPEEMFAVMQAIAAVHNASLAQKGQ